MRIVLLIVLVIGISGCVALRKSLGFEQPADPATAEPSAYVVCENSSRRLLVKDRDDAELLTVTAVDAASTRSYWQGLFYPTSYATAVALKSGSHQLQILYQDAVFYGSGELTFTAEAGKTYKLKKRVLGLNVQFWIEDDLGQRVGGTTNSDLHGADKT